MNIEHTPWRAGGLPTLAPVAPRRPLRIRLYLLLLVSDLLCVAAGMLGGALLRFGQVFPDGWLAVSVPVLVLFAFAGLGSGAYSLDVLRSPGRGTARAGGSLMLAFALLFLLSYFLKVDQQLSRLMTGASFLIGLTLLVTVRQFLGDAIRRRWSGLFTNDILLFDGPEMPVPEGMIGRSAQDLGIAPDASNSANLIQLSDLLRGADRVVISCSEEAKSRWAGLLKGTNVQGEILSYDHDHLAPIGIGKVGDRTSLVVSTGPLNLRQRAAKRAFDLLLCIPALILLAPVFLLIALAIKLESRGPVLFRQPRVGEGNALFQIFKFRSMRADRADLRGNQSATRDDDRVTRVGRLLRRTSADELPQLLNVLLGSMSVVGPRPHALGSLAGEQLFWHIDERYWHRHSLKPGITGLAQVRGFRGATHTREHLTSRLQSDLEYVAGWSLWRDVEIVARTARVLVHEDAY